MLPGRNEKKEHIMTKKKTETKRPTHELFVVHGEDDNARWTKIGAAWMHKDQKGANIILDALPNGGRTVMRAIKENEDTNTGGQQ